MALKSIIVPFFEEKSAEAAFHSAAIIAKYDKAHISVVHLRARPAPPTNVYFPLGGMSTEFTESFQKAEDQLAGNLKALFAKLCEKNGIGNISLDERTSDHGVTADWSDMEGDPLSDYARQATAFDLSVLAAASDDATPMEESVAEAMLFQSGRPVLLCPATGLAAVPEKVVVAWNGSQEAARAVGATLEFLKEAAVVTVISVRRTDAPYVNTDEITAFLRLHGVNAARTKIEVSGDESVNARLDEEIRKEKPDLLVMGAYSHSRWRQAVLGGFTRHMIHEAKLPTLMMH